MLDMIGLAKINRNLLVMKHRDNKIYQNNPKKNRKYLI